LFIGLPVRGDVIGPGVHPVVIVPTAKMHAKVAGSTVIEGNRTVQPATT
jgi:hypothetical protein